MKNKARLAFEMLEKEMEVIGAEEQFEIFGGTGSTGVDSAGIYDGYKTYLQTQVSALDSFPTSALSADDKRKLQNHYQGLINEVDTLTNSSNKYSITSTPLPEGATKIGGYTNYNASNNAIEATVQLKPDGSIDWSIVGHEVHHQFQFESGGIDKNDIRNTHTIDDERDAYEIQYFLNNGLEYLNNPDKFRNSIEKDAQNSMNTRYGSTGTAQDENPANPNIQGSTGILANDLDFNGNWVQNFYYYDNTDAQYDFNEMISASSGFSGFSTGYKNLTTGEIVANISDEQLYTPISTGNSTGNESTDS
jgi:hypothetical protein